jgi:hypothetical protein
MADSDLLLSSPVIPARDVPSLQLLNSARFIETSFGAFRATQALHQSDNFGASGTIIVIMYTRPGSQDELDFCVIG